LQSTTCRWVKHHKDIYIYIYKLHYDELKLIQLS
jgi:hypothetical protein